MTTEDLVPESEADAKEILRIAGEAIKQDTVQIFDLMYRRLIRDLGKKQADSIWNGFKADMKVWEEKRAKEIG